MDDFITLKIYENNIRRFSDNIWRLTDYNSSELISFILSLLKYIPSEKKVIENKKVAVKPLENQFHVSSETPLSGGKKVRPEDIKDEKMLAAVAAAVIDAAGETDNAYIKVRSIREIN